MLNLFFCQCLSWLEVSGTISEIFLPLPFNALPFLLAASQVKQVSVFVFFFCQLKQIGQQSRVNALIWSTEIICNYILCDWFFCLENKTLIHLANSYVKVSLKRDQVLVWRPGQFPHPHLNNTSILLSLLWFVYSNF